MMEALDLSRTTIKDNRHRLGPVSVKRLVRETLQAQALFKAEILEDSHILNRTIEHNHPIRAHQVHKVDSKSRVGMA